MNTSITIDRFNIRLGYWLSRRWDYYFDSPDMEWLIHHFGVRILGFHCYVVWFTSNATVEVTEYE